MNMKKKLQLFGSTLCLTTICMTAPLVVSSCGWLTGDPIDISGISTKTTWNNSASLGRATSTGINNPSWDVKGDDAGQFSIDQSTGELTYSGGLVAEETTYSIYLECNGFCSDSIEITIGLESFKAEVNNLDYTLSVNETIVGTVEYKDIRTGSTVEVDKSNQELQVLKDNQPDANNNNYGFSINDENGIVFDNTSRTSKEVTYKLIVSATKDGYMFIEQQSWEVTVSQGSIAITIDDMQSYLSKDKNKAGTAKATDTDTNKAITNPVWSLGVLDAGNMSDPANNNFGFEIDETTGDIYFTGTRPSTKSNFVLIVHCSADGYSEAKFDFNVLVDVA